MNLATREVVSDWTVIASPTATETVTTTSAMNTIRGNNPRERMELVVQSDYADTALAQSRAVQYEIENLSAVDD